MSDSIENQIPTGKKGYALWSEEDPVFNPNDKEETRTTFKHDGDEIVYSAAFRRISDKSQVVVKPTRVEQFRSRLTHTLEVEHIADSIGCKLKLNPLLIKAIATGHDIGHSPFGHCGERQFQEIMRSDVLPLCNIDNLQKAIEQEYGKKLKFDAGQCENPYLLFHHAVNSIRVIQRKMKNISKQTTDGIIKHSWSPWQDNPKFGIPTTYEGQVVAIADQIASINHDTEDILSFKKVLYDRETIHDKLPEYFQKKGIMTFAEAQQILERWFLKKDSDCNEKNGWGRKYRLREIINDIFSNSYEKLKNNKVDSSKRAVEVSLVASEGMLKFLCGYEKFIREEIIGNLSWFKQRDAHAAATILTVYNLYKHYAVPKHEEEKVLITLPISLRPLVQELADQFRNSVSKDKYAQDIHYNIFITCANEDNAGQIRHIIQTIDYVSGMTDRYLMESYEIASNLFR